MSASVPDDRSKPAAARTLILLRHGKSDYPSGLRDFDRPLADRGEGEAGAAGRWLRSTQPRIDAVLCSAALRTRQTFAATGIVASVRYSENVYEASPGDVLAEIRLTESAVRTLLVVGHAPGMPGLAMRLATDDSDESAMRELSTKFPTSAMAVLEFTGEWSALDAGGARLTDFHVARSRPDDHT